MKLLIANLASPANPGDQAIFQGALKLLKSVYPGAEFTVVTRAYSQKHVYEHFGLKVVPNYPDVECIATDSRVKKILNLPKTLFSPGKLKNAVREADIVFLIGGAYFYSYRPGMPGFTYLSHFSAIYWAKVYGKPVVFLPQSYGPFQSWISLRMFDWAIQAADLVYYRENISGEWLLKRYPRWNTKFIFMPDLALYLEKEDVVLGKKEDSRKTIGVTIRAWESGGVNQFAYLNVLKETLTKLCREYSAMIRVIVQVQDPKKGEGDEWISRELVTALQNEVGKERAVLVTKSPYFSLSEIGRLYRECDLMIGMRLHSGLISYVAGTPALVAGYQHKAEGILKDLGLKELYLGSFAELGAEHLYERCRNVLNDRENWTKKIEGLLEHARAEIRNVFEANQQRIKK